MESRSPGAAILALISCLLLAGADGGAAPPLTEELPPGAAGGPAPGPHRAVVHRERVDPRHLEPELRALAARAARSGARVLVELGASWCEPCRALDAAFARESNRAVLAGWWLVEVDVDALPPGPVLGRPRHTVPALIRLGASGRPEATLDGTALRVDDASRLDQALARLLRLDAGG